MGYLFKKKGRRTYDARYRDENRKWVQRSTGCTDKRLAENELRRWEEEVTQIRLGVVKRKDLDAVKSKDDPIGSHLAEYLGKLKSSEKHRSEKRRQLGTILSECRFETLRDLEPKPVEDWVESRDCSPRTKNTYLTSVAAFGNWLLGNGRLTSNPFASISKCKESKSRQRRSLTTEEVERLLYVAARRPVADFGREKVKTSTGWRFEDHSFDTIDAAYARGLNVLKDPESYIRLGEERVLMYLTMLSTGLRRGELASLEVSDVDLRSGWVVCPATQTKNHKEARLPLRKDLVEILRPWIHGRTGKLFTVPVELVKILNRDLIAADIPKIDERGRTVDVHGLRHTFGTHLSVAGVTPRVAMKAMRHSDLSLTMNIYTDDSLLDTVSAVESLPWDRSQNRSHERVTCGHFESKLAASSRSEEIDVSRGEIGVCK